MNAQDANPVALEIEGRRRDLGGFEVSRVLPSRKQRMVGPFIFFDHMGPTDFDPGQGADVRPHPHIGLATVTYLLDGAFLHRDSLGTEQLIEPGAVNWMNSGSGIVHSERTPLAVRHSGSRAHGLQFWVALPKNREDMDATFEHRDQKDLPEFGHDGVSIRLIAGTAFGKTSPVTTQSPLFYLDITMPSHSRFTLSAEYTDRALYPLDAPIRTNGTVCNTRTLAILKSSMDVEIEAHEPTRLMIFGGEPLDGDRYIWWNLVSSSKDRIETAKRDWAEGRFAKVPGDDKEFIPLPEHL